jgi:hypothetical protein
MLNYSVVLRDKKVKSLKAVNMDTIYVNYNKYCKSRGFRKDVQHRGSVGFVAWENPKGEQLLLLRIT